MKIELKERKNALVSELNIGDYFLVPSDAVVPRVYRMLLGGQVINARSGLIVSISQDTIVEILNLKLVEV